MGCKVFHVCQEKLLKSLHFFVFVFTDESLEWESIEQYFLWQLIMAHNIPTEHILPVLPKLEYSGKCIGTYA